MKKNGIKILALIIIIAVSQIAFAQELLTLDDAIAIALKDNHNVQIARNSANITENNAHIGAAGLLPRVDVVSTATHTDNKLKSTTGTVNENYTRTAAGVQATYTLFDGLSNVYTYKKLYSLSESGNLQARNQIELSIIDVSNEYFSVAEASENLRIASQSLEISRERLERAKNRSRFGQANTIEVLSAEVDFNTDSVSYVNAELLLAQSKRNLNVLLNRDVNYDFQVNFDVNFIENLNLQEIQNTAVENNAVYLLTKKNTQQSEFDLKISQSAYMPELDFQTYYGYNQTENNWGVAINNPNRSFTAGLSLNFNLFNGFQNSVKNQNAKIQLKNQQIQQEEALLSLQSGVENSYQAYQNSLYVLKVQQKNFETVELNFTRTKELYELGQVTTTQFREAQLNLIKAKNNILSAKYNAKINEIQLLRLGGNLIKTEN